MYRDRVAICQTDHNTGEVHPILFAISKTASLRTNSILTAVHAFVCVTTQVVYVTLIILVCTVNCRFRFGHWPLVHCEHNRSHVATAEFKEINWLPIEHTVAQRKLNLVYRIVNGSAPEYLQNDFNHVSQTHSVSSH